MYHFLDTDIREQKMYEMRTQTSVDNTVNDLHYEIKFDFFFYHNLNTQNMKNEKLTKIY